MPLDSTNWPSQSPVCRLEGLAAWLREQPPERTYQWPRIDECVFGIYRRYLEVQNPGWMSPLLHDMAPDRATYEFIGGTEPWTFGAALARCEAAIAERRAAERATEPAA